VKNTKILSTFFKALVCVGSLAVITLFFFNFVNVGEYALTGFESAFSSKQTVAGQEVNTFKSAWYMLAFLLNVFTLVFAATNFKVKGAKYASFGFSIAAFVNMCMIYFANPITMYFDKRTNIVGAKDLEIATEAITKELPFLLALIGAGVVMVLATVSMLVSDNAEVSVSNGTKITIPRRIKRFFKDYKREIKNIVWPSRATVFKNFLVVIVMCAIVGAYICLLDFGLASLLEFIVGLKG